MAKRIAAAIKSIKVWSVVKGCEGDRRRKQVGAIKNSGRSTRRDQDQSTLLACCQDHAPLGPMTQLASGAQYYYILHVALSLPPTDFTSSWISFSVVCMKVYQLLLVCRLIPSVILPGNTVFQARPPVKYNSARFQHPLTPSRVLHYLAGGGGDLAGYG
jgi:hypothetical protein